MTVQPLSLARPAATASLPELIFGLAGGPLAWFVQFNADYALSSWSCFPHDHRMRVPLDGYAWSMPTLVVILVAAVAIGLASLAVAWRNLRASPAATAGRTHFLSLWGVLLGAGFAVTSLVTGVAFIVLPRCSG